VSFGSIKMKRQKCTDHCSHLLVHALYTLHISSSTTERDTEVHTERILRRERKDCVVPMRGK
jgi:hypothetical protein